LPDLIDNPNPFETLYEFTEKIINEGGELAEGTRTIWNSLLRKMKYEDRWLSYVLDYLNLENWYDKAPLDT